MHTSICVANKLIELAKDNDRKLTPMQVIKLVYLCHGWMLGIHQRPLIQETIEAWSYGPVIRDLYTRVREFKNGPVPLLEDCPHEDFTEQEFKLIKDVYRAYEKFNGIQLSQITHESGSPWSTVWDMQGKNSVIPNDLIQIYFAKKAAA